MIAQELRIMAAGIWPHVRAFVGFRCEGCTVDVMVGESAHQRSSCWLLATEMNIIFKRNLRTLLMAYEGADRRAMRLLLTQ